MPSQFLPTLRDNAPTIIIEGTASELDFPDLEDAVNVAYIADTKVDSPFQTYVDRVMNEGSDHLNKKIEELNRELELR